MQRPEDARTVLETNRKEDAPGRDELRAWHQRASFQALWR